MKDLEIYYIMSKRITELEQQNKELKDVLVELSEYNFSNIDWNEASNIKSLIESVLNK